VIFIALLRSFKRYTATAIADTTFKVVTVDIWLSFCDVFVFSNDVYLGDQTDQDLDINAGDVYSITHAVNINDLVFKNKIAGNNAKVVLSGVPLTEEQIRERGLK